LIDVLLWGIVDEWVWLGLGVVSLGFLGLVVGLIFVLFFG